MTANEASTQTERERRQRNQTIEKGRGLEACTRSHWPLISKNTHEPRARSAANQQQQRIETQKRSNAPWGRIKDQPGWRKWMDKATRMDKKHRKARQNRGMDTHVEHFKQMSTWTLEKFGNPCHNHRESRRCSVVPPRSIHRSPALATWAGD